MPERPILVVDDEPSIRSLVAEALELEGYTVMTACDGREALKLIERSPPALLILDLWMPRLNGPALAEALAERGIVLPIVVMTASNAADPWARAIDARAYLQKPFDLADFLDAIEHILDGRGGAIAAD
jgi:DNA-binding NtrC family response regulator